MPHSIIDGPGDEILTFGAVIMYTPDGHVEKNNSCVERKSVEDTATFSMFGVMRFLRT